MMIGGGDHGPPDEASASGLEKRCPRQRDASGTASTLT
jgi:hypothetical protein